MANDASGQELSDQDRLLLVFGYLGPLALVTLIASRREFVKWHAKQGLAVSFTLVGLYLFARLSRHLMSKLMDSIAQLFWFAGMISLLGIGIAIVVCIVRGLEGERFKLPLLGDLADWI